MSHFWAPIPITLNDEFINDVLVTAFDGDYGGSLYWALDYSVSTAPATRPTSDNAIVSRVMETWVSVKILDVDGGPEPAIKVIDRNSLTAATILLFNNIRQREVEKGRYFLLDWERQVLEAITEPRGGDAGAIDADGADAWVQYAAFGELIFG